MTTEWHHSKRINVWQWWPPHFSAASCSMLSYVPSCLLHNLHIGFRVPTWSCVEYPRTDLRRDMQGSRLLGFFVDDSSDDCVDIRKMGGLCGCSVPPDACRLCPGGFGLSDPLKELGASLSDVLAAASAGLALNCAFVDSYLQVVSQDDEFCSSTKEIFRQECSCLETVK